MKDPLKRFIEQHRDDFDIETPDESLRERLAGKINIQGSKTPFKRMPGWMNYAAAACGLVFISYIALKITGTIPQKTETINITQSARQLQPDPLLQGIDPGSAREMQRMVHEASQRESGLALLQKDDPALYRRFLSDLAELDSVYHSLREMLTRTPNHQQLIEAMEENLQMRLLLLERQNQIIQDIKRNKKPRS